MISNPKHGWCNFELGDFHGTPSYLTNVPLDLLWAFKDCLYSGTGICWLDEEGSEFTLVLTPYSIFIIEEKEKPVLHNFSEMNIDDLVKEVVADIESNIEEWSEFDAFYNGADDEYIEFNKSAILNLIKLIKRKWD